MPATGPVPDPPDLDGKVALVTGGGGGIGRAIVLALLRQGARVVALDVDTAGLEATAADAGAGGDDLLTARCDVSVEDDVTRVVAQAQERFGQLDVAVNNAAISVPGTAVETRADDFDRVYAVNVRGPFLVCKHAIPAMVAGGGGSIVNVGSINSLVAERFLVSYCASKGALLMLTRAVAFDHANEGVRCNIVCPGYVDTPINLAHAERFGGIEAVRAGMPSYQPIGRYGRTMEVAEAVLFLASERSSFMTGAALVVDGGLTAGV